MKWVNAKLVPFLKAHWKVILAVLAGIAAAWLGKEVVTVVHRAIAGVLAKQVKSPLPFVVVDPAHVLVSVDGEPRIVDVGAMGIDAKAVEAVGDSDGNAVKVQVKNPPLG